MLMTLLAGALAIATPQQQTDTTFAVRARGTVDIESMNGTVTVGTWDRQAMRVRATHRGSTRIDVQHTGSNVSVEAESRGRPEPVNLEITVPLSYDVRVDGLNLGITVQGTRGSVSLENVQGAIAIRDVAGRVDAESVSGSVTVESVRGDVDVSTVNEAIHITGVRGNVAAETVNGSIVMRGIDAADVNASTVNGLVEYHGTVRDAGRYFLATHNGAITMAIPEQANARLSIETGNGRVQSVFPVRVTGAGERSYSFTLGTGSARIELESYNGAINLVRPVGR